MRIDIGISGDRLLVIAFAFMATLALAGTASRQTAASFTGTTVNPANNVATMLVQVPASQNNAASAAGRDLRAALAPLLVAPLDERPHAVLSTGPKPTTSVGLYVVTHVDVVPTKREDGTAEIRKLVEASRGSAGNVRFDALVQAGRPNHLTLVEAWTNTGTQETHSAAQPTRSFRSARLRPPRPDRRG